MITEKELHKFIKALIQHIEDFQVDYSDNPNLDKLKRLLSDNVSEEGEIHTKSSLQNREDHLFISNCAFYMDRFKEEDLYN